MLLVFVTKFDLEIIQLDTINTFIYINLNKTVFIRMFSEYGKNGKVLHLNKTIYGL